MADAELMDWYDEMMFKVEQYPVLIAALEHIRALRSRYIIPKADTPPGYLRGLAQAYEEAAQIADAALRGQGQGKEGE